MTPFISIFISLFHTNNDCLFNSSPALHFNSHIFFLTFQFSRSKTPKFPFIYTVPTANIYSSIPISNFFTARLTCPEDGSSIIPETCVTYPREQQF